MFISTTSNQTLTFDPAASSSANPAPLQTERELHSNTPNSVHRDATVAVEEEKGGNGSSSSNIHSPYRKNQTSGAAKQAARDPVSQSAAGTYTH